MKSSNINSLKMICLILTSLKLASLKLSSLVECYWEVQILEGR